jgi:hypothetical protein
MKSRPSNDLKIWRERWKRWRQEAQQSCYLVGWVYNERWWFVMSYQQARRREMEATNGK